MTKVSVVNMIPKYWSDEQNQDAEPGLSVNPANPDEIVATAFTWDNPAGSSALSPAMLGAWAPVYLSTDEGKTWSLQFILPSGVGAIFPTFDVTVRFSGNKNNLYAGLISAVSSQIVITRTPHPTVHMNTLTTIPGDQPFIEAATHGGKDKVFVGINAFGGALVNQSQDANAGPPPSGFAPVSIDSRNHSGGPGVRTAIHRDGTVYIAFFSQNAGAGAGWDVVVVKDTNWGNSLPNYQSLVDSGDLKQGVRVATGINPLGFHWENPNFGNDRHGFDMAIAVDPHKPKRLYIVYSDGFSTSDNTLHLRQSVDGGITWQPDVRTIVRAKNPGIAVNESGDVGFLYQQLIGPVAGPLNWMTVFEQTKDNFASFDSQILANVPSSVPVPATVMATYIGDYAKLQAHGENFYGIFSANNTPDLSHFPSGVHYQRNANFTTKILLANDDITPVPSSIDPFFFIVKEHKEHKELKEERHEEHQKFESLTDTGKIASLIFDHFGDFEGFVLETRSGKKEFLGCEMELKALAERAWRERLRIIVKTDLLDPHRILAIILQHPPDPFGI